VVIDTLFGADLTRCGLSESGCSCSTRISGLVQPPAAAGIDWRHTANRGRAAVSSATCGPGCRARFTLTKWSPRKPGAKAVIVVTNQPCCGAGEGNGKWCLHNQSSHTHNLGLCKPSPPC